MLKINKRKKKKKIQNKMQSYCFEYICYCLIIMKLAQIM